jgi:tetratricopeptide (TPR) repeat protein
MSVERALRIITLLVVALAITGCSREAKARRHLQRANNYFNTQQYTKAEIEYLNVLRFDGANATAIRQLGFSLFEQGRYPQAFAFLQRAKVADPSNVEVRSKLGFGALLARNLSQAREEALFVLGRQPTNEEALVLLADAVEPGEIQKTKDLLQTYRPHAAGLAGFHVAMGLLELRMGDAGAAETSLKEAVRLNPRSATARATLGNFYLRQKQPEFAEEQMKAAADVARARSLLSMSYADFKIKQGRHDEGKKLLDELANKTPDFVPVHVRRAELAFSQRNYDEAESVLKTITSRGHANFDAQFLLARVRLARGDTAGAITEFQRLLTAFPKAPQLHYQLALTHLAARDTAAASASLSEALALDPTYADAILLSADLDARKGDYASAIAALSEMLARDTNSTQARVLLAAAHAGRKDYPAALAEYQKLAEAFPREPQFAFAIGNLYLQQRNTNAARQAFERALSTNKDYLPAFDRLIDLDLQSGKQTEALEKVQARVTEAATNAPLHLLLARVLLAHAETNKAEAAMLKAVELNPEFRSAHVMLAELYVSTGRHQDALARLEAVLAKRPGDIGALMIAAAIQDSLKNFPASRAYYEKVMAIYPNSPAALNNLAYIFSEHLNDLGRAFELAQKARAVSPRDPATADTLGWILHKRGEHGRALGLLEESAQALPEHPEVLFHLGMTQYALGQEEPARASFEKALAQGRDFSGKAECEQRLGILTMKVESANADAARRMEQLLEKRPGDPIVQGRLARLYEALGERPKAARLYESQLKQHPNNVTAMVRLAALYALYAESEKTKGMELARKARALAPTDPVVSHSLGRLAHTAGDHKWALSLLQESARKLPENPQVALDLAVAQFSNGQLREAEASLIKVTAASGSDAELKSTATALLRWVRLCLNPEEPEKAAVQIEQALKGDPNHLAARFLNGVIQRRKGDFKGAQTTFEGILQRYPAFVFANKELAYIYSEHVGDYQRALDHALKAREADRQDPRVARTLGIVSYKRNDFRRSVELLKETVQDPSADAEAHFYLGMAQFKLGDVSQSRAALRKALELDGNARFAPEAKETLSQLQ